MYKNRLEEIKEIHEKANEAYNSFESSSACADEDIIKDSLSTLFYEEHTDWLIEQAEKAKRYEKALKEIVEAKEKYYGNEYPDVVDKIAQNVLDG